MEWIDTKILKYLNFDNGIYLECGANDGVTQSNTIILEKEKNWSGVLIEPSIYGYEKCLQNRSDKNIILNYALVSNDFDGDTVVGDFDGNLMASINGHRIGRSNLVEVKAKKLSSLLEEINIKEIDFFSLDVEGYELDVLKGIDFNKHKFKWVLIEIYQKDLESIFDLMEKNNYILIENLSGFTHESNPGWDGTHNDYLFKLNES